jgi:hypothetical protein
MPLVNLNVNRLVSSAQRATTLSLQSVLARLALAASLAVLGDATARVGVAGALVGSAVVLGVAGLVLWLRAPAAPQAGGVPCREGRV